MGRSIVAVVAGFLAVAGLSLATDQLFHVLEVYPPWGQPMYDTGHTICSRSRIVLSTRCSADSSRRASRRGHRCAT